MIKKLTNLIGSLINKIILELKLTQKGDDLFYVILKKIRSHFWKNPKIELNAIYIYIYKLILKLI